MIADQLPLMGHKLMICRVPQSGRGARLVVIGRASRAAGCTPPPLWRPLPNAVGRDAPFLPWVSRPDGGQFIPHYHALETKCRGRFCPAPVAA